MPPSATNPLLLPCSAARVPAKQYGREQCTGVGCPEGKFNIFSSSQRAPSHVGEEVHRLTSEACFDMLLLQMKVLEWQSLLMVYAFPFKCIKMS